MPLIERRMSILELLCTFAHAVRGDEACCEVATLHSLWHPHHAQVGSLYMGVLDFSFFAVIWSGIVPATHRGHSI
jgi:hypothetical protein